MDAVHEDRFDVYLRLDRGHGTWRPDIGERRLASCSSYEEARTVRDSYQRSGGKCVIRYVGPAGGGD